MDKELWLKGDLLQMSSQDTHLIFQGIPTRRVDVYPVVNAENRNRALYILWTDSVDGWWLYEEEFIELGLCTHEEYVIKLRRQCYGR
jgi:hypothetical protein